MIPLVAPTITPSDRAAFLHATSTGRLFDEARVRELEEAFAAYVGCRWAVAVNSGSSALTIALTLTDVTDAPSWSCVAAANAMLAAGRQKPFSDTSWDIEAAQAYSSSGLRVHMFGRPTIGDPPPTVEDWTLSLGGIDQLQGRLGVCSTHASKMLSTGRGGLIFGNDNLLHDQARELAYYETHTRFGYGAAMSSMQAVLGLSQLHQQPRFIERRQQFAARYSEAFTNAGIACPRPGCPGVFFRYLIGVTDPAAKQAALAGKGIEAGRGVYPPLHQLAGIPDQVFPGTTDAINRLLSIPIHPSISDRDADHIIESVLQECGR